MEDADRTASEQVTQLSQAQRDAMFALWGCFRVRATVGHRYRELEQVFLFQGSLLSHIVYTV